MDEVEWKPGDRVWLLPDGDKREVKSKQPGIVKAMLPSGRVRVLYYESRCLLAKTVLAKRIEARAMPCFELQSKGYEPK
jgi:hypothetical protein